jgi:hypothetical protein
VATTESADPRDVAVAMLGGRCRDGGPDYATIEALHRGEVDDWLRALGSSGLLSEGALAELGAAWHANPRTLLDILLTEVDEMTARRCRTSWAALDRLAPLSRIV